MKRGHPCQLRFWNRQWPIGERWEVDCISHLSVEDKTVESCKVEDGRAFTESELRDELKAAFKAGREKDSWPDDQDEKWVTFDKWWDFAAWYEQFKKETE